MAIVEPHAALGFRCAVCGGPRLLLDATELQLGPEATGSLRAAGKEHTKQLLLGAAGISLLALGAVALLVATGVLLATTPGIAATLLTLLGCSVPLGVGFRVLARAAFARSLRADALHAARLSALQDAQAALGTLPAARVAELLHIDTEQAELLLAEASVAALLESAAPRLRIDAEHTQAPGELAAEANPTEPSAERKVTEA